MPKQIALQKFNQKRFFSSKKYTVLNPIIWKKSVKLVEISSFDCFLCCIRKLIAREPEVNLRARFYSSKHKVSYLFNSKSNFARQNLKIALIFYLSKDKSVCHVSINRCMTFLILFFFQTEFQEEQFGGSIWNVVRWQQQFEEGERSPWAHDLHRHEHR